MAVLAVPMEGQKVRYLSIHDCTQAGLLAVLEIYLRDASYNHRGWSL